MNALLFAALILFDGSTAKTPDGEGWTYLTQPLFGASAKSFSEAGAAHLDSLTAIDQKAGYFSRMPLLGAGLVSLPVLDRDAGFAVEISAQLFAESHQSQARSGFSMIVLSSDHKGVELAFWENEVFAQSDAPIFTHGEGIETDTKTMQTYRLSIKGDGYTLSSGDREILSGAVKDYSSFGLPYTLTSFIFFGDDTSSAGAHFAVSSLSVATAAEPTFREVPLEREAQLLGAEMHWLD